MGFRDNVDEPKGILTIWEESIGDLEKKVILRKGNVFTNVAKQIVCDYLGKASTYTGMDHFALGTGVTAASATDTSLEVERYREAIDSFSRSGQVGTYTTVIDYGEANGYSYTEAGLFNQSSGGQMAARTVFSPRTKTASVKWTVEWKLYY